jgi:TPP-dependent pyruvate/acetoin dehydrogenase alpha subunit
MSSPQTTTRSYSMRRRARREALRRSPLELLRRMLEIRLVEERIQQLFVDGFVHGTTHTCQGQEAVAVALAAAASPEDVVTATYRGHGVALALGATPEEVIGEVLGREIGCVGGLGGSMHMSAPDVGLLPTFAVVGAGIPIAVGAALAMTMPTAREDSIGVAVFGDGAANIGAFHEAMNLASIWSVPVLFLCENNLYGEYTRIDRTTPIENIAERATAYGIEGVVVDGQNVLSLKQRLRSVIDDIRRTRRPVLVEVKTYRFSGHSRSDAAAYRPEGELEWWLARDPINVLSAELTAQGLGATVAKLRAQVGEAVDEAVGAALQSPAPQSSHSAPIYAAPKAEMA